MKRYAVRASALLIGVTSAAGCGGSGTPTPATVTSSVTVTQMVGTSSSPEPVSPDGTGTISASVQQATTEAFPDAPTGPPILSGITSAPRKLVLGDVFEHERWEEGSVTVPKRSGTIQGIWTRLECGDQPSLELRFADQKGLFRVEVAQALDSYTSGTVMEFQLFADGRLVDTALVKFSAQGRLETSLTGISSVELQVRTHSSGTTCSATAVVTAMSVTPGPA